MKDKKGQVNQVGTLILLAITAIVGLILLQGSAANVESTLDTVALVNQSLGSTAVNGTAIYITNVKYIDTPVFINETNGTVGVKGAVLAAGNYTVTNNVVYNGQEAVKVVPNTQAEWKSNWFVSGTAHPLTYINDSGSRAVTGLIILLMALGLAVVVISYGISQRVD